MLGVLAAMILITREYISFGVSENIFAASILFLIVSMSLVATSLRGVAKSVEFAIFACCFGSGCLTVGRLMMSTNVKKIGNIQIQRLKTLAQATELYAGDNSEKLPLASVWMDSLSNRVTEADFNLGTTFLPPKPGYHVAMNSDLNGKSLAELDSKNKYCLFFISYKTERNANDALHSIREDRQGISVSGVVRPFDEAVSPNNSGNVHSAISK